MMAHRFPRTCRTAILFAAILAAVPVAAFAQDPRVAPKQQKKPPEAPSKLPKVGADRTRGLDFLFGALKAAPDEASAKHVEARIWALWLQTPSDTAALLMTRAKAAMDADLLVTAQRLVRRLPVGDSVVEAILSLVRSARPGPEGGDAGKLIAWGPGPRASQSLMLAVRARALLDGRLAPSIDDVLDLAEPVLKHRMALTFSARAEGRTIPDVIRQLKARIG